MKTPLAALVFAALAGPATAATISVSSFGSTAYNAATSGISGASQNFESHSEGNVADGLSTNVGTFSSLGGQGRKRIAYGDRSQLAMRDGIVKGRTSTTRYLTGNAADDMFLDNNDTHGIVWNVALAGGAMFDKIVFTITDAAELGNSMLIAMGNDRSVIEPGGRGAMRLVEIIFDEAVSDATITLSHFYGEGPAHDAFGIDDIRVGNVLPVSEVPLPASALLLLGGLGGLAAMRRRTS